MKKLNPLVDAVSFVWSALIALMFISIILACNSVIFLITYQFVHHDVVMVSIAQGLFMLFIGVITYFFTKWELTKTDL